MVWVTVVVVPPLVVDRNLGERALDVGDHHDPKLAGIRCRTGTEEAAGTPGQQAESQRAGQSEWHPCPECPHG